MNYATRCSIGLAIGLGAGLLLGLSWKASAEVQRCKGAGCNDKSPTEYRCDLDAVITEEVTITVHRRLESWQPRQITIQKLYSAVCGANWTRAYIPENTYLFIRGQEPVDGSQPIYGLLQTQGTGYFWADSNMANGYVANQACASLPTGIWFWYDRYCTDFDEDNTAITSREEVP